MVGRRAQDQLAPRGPLLRQPSQQVLVIRQGCGLERRAAGKLALEHGLAAHQPAGNTQYVQRFIAQHPQGRLVQHVGMDQRTI